MSQRVVDSGYPALPFWVNDHGRDDLQSVTLASGSSVLVSGQVLALSSSGQYIEYAGTGSSGDAEGILLHRADPTHGSVLVSLFTHGKVRSGSLVGLDSDARTALSHIQFV